MVIYNFQKIAPVLNSTEMITFVLTEIQKKNPTVIHSGCAIFRIRNFYMKKVKFTQQTIDGKLGAILQDFPRLDDIHPFYAGLMNSLFDRDHFQLALDQISTAKNIINKISKEYITPLKFGESLNHCKELRRMALGRMFTIIKKLKAALGYLVEVRKHISRLPALDPNTRTLLLTGYPNVGKSSFMNKVTRADVDVQPYAFTTKAFFVGQTEHNSHQFQVVDTPGILDRPLEERNTIEMQAITALAHLQCCVLYFLDISEQYGFPIEQQLKLFESIRPLFANKQVMVVANKTDVIPYENLPEATRKRLEKVISDAKVELIPMSNVSEENVSAVKALACEKCLSANQTNEEKTQTDLEGVSLERVTEKQLMLNNGGAGVYVCDYRKYYQLKEDEWSFDAMPEIMDGKNVMDFFDPEIEELLNALEQEEEDLDQGDTTIVSTNKENQTASKVNSPIHEEGEKESKIDIESSEKEKQIYEDLTNENTEETPPPRYSCPYRAFLLCISFHRQFCSSSR